MTTTHSLQKYLVSLHDTKGSGVPKQTAKRSRYCKEICEACGMDYGDFVVCITCTAKFHLICCEPPIMDDSRRLSHWKCRRCAYIAKNTKDPVRSKAHRSRKGGRSLSRSRKSVKKQDNDLSVPLPPQELSEVVVKVEPLSEYSDAVKQFFEKFIRSSLQENPTEFRLGSEYGSREYPFVGASRSCIKKGKAAKPRGNIIDWESTDTAHKSLCYCHVCCRSARVAALIKCDFCAFAFHFDCLDPPLVTPPVGLWMCPCHSHRVEEYCANKRLSYTERVALYERSKLPLQVMSIELDFIRKCKNPLFRRKIQTPLNNAVVPNGVRRAYGLSWNDTSNETYGSNPNFRGIDALADAAELFRLGMESEIEVKNVQKKRKWAAMQRPVKGKEDPVNKGICDLNCGSSTDNRVQDASECLAVTSVLQDSECSHHDEQRMGRSDVVTQIELVLHNTLERAVYRGTELVIGLCDDAALNLSHITCKRVSRVHAVVYYNSIREQWELLNYSPHGTVVNRCMYSVDSVNNGMHNGFSSTVNRLEPGCNPLQARLEELRERRRVLLNLMLECPCDDGVGFDDCWEGPAVLSKGTMIQIGCAVITVLGCKALREFIPIRLEPEITSSDTSKPKEKTINQDKLTNDSMMTVVYEHDDPDHPFARPRRFSPPSSPRPITWNMTSNPFTILTAEEDLPSDNPKSESDVKIRNVQQEETHSPDAPNESTSHLSLRIFS